MNTLGPVGTYPRAPKSHTISPHHSHPDVEACVPYIKGEELPVLKTCGKASKKFLDRNVPVAFSIEPPGLADARDLALR